MQQASQVASQPSSVSTKPLIFEVPSHSRRVPAHCHAADVSSSCESRVLSSTADDSRRATLSTILSQTCTPVLACWPLDAACFSGTLTVMGRSHHFAFCPPVHLPAASGTAKRSAAQRNPRGIYFACSLLRRILARPASSSADPARWDRRGAIGGTLALLPALPALPWVVGQVW